MDQSRHSLELPTSCLIKSRWEIKLPTIHHGTVEARSHRLCLLFSLGPGSPRISAIPSPHRQTGALCSVCGLIFFLFTQYKKCGRGRNFAVETILDFFKDFFCLFFWIWTFKFYLSPLLLAALQHLPVTREGLAFFPLEMYWKTPYTALSVDFQSSYNSKFVWLFDLILTVREGATCKCAAQSLIRGALSIPVAHSASLTFY